MQKDPKWQRMNSFKVKRDPIYNAVVSEGALKKDALSEGVVNKSMIIMARRDILNESTPTSSKAVAKTKEMESNSAGGELEVGT